MLHLILCPRFPSRNLQLVTNLVNLRYNALIYLKRRRQRFLMMITRNLLCQLKLILWCPLSVQVLKTQFFSFSFCCLYLCMHRLWIFFVVISGEMGEKAKVVQPLVSCRKKRTVAKPILKAAPWGKLISQSSQV